VSRWWLSGLFAWIALLGIGIEHMARFETTAGTSANTPVEWPAESRIARAADRDTLVVFLHPKCPCSRATLSELNAIMNDARASSRIAPVIAFVADDGVAPDWHRTAIWDDALRIPGAIRILDAGGVEAERFGAETSGFVLLYGRDGRLRFSGGITDSRGHAGNNVGRQQVIALVDDESAAPATHAVFGCVLRDREGGDAP
jgi:hypothetical protein